MSESLPALEKDRSEVVRQITQLGDFRPGSIVGVMGRCSKPNCRCAQTGDPGHGPNFRLTAKVNGKTVAETLSSPAALRKAQREVVLDIGPRRTSGRGRAGRVLVRGREHR